MIVYNIDNNAPEHIQRGTKRWTQLGRTITNEYKNFMRKIFPFFLHRHPVADFWKIVFRFFVFTFLLFNGYWMSDFNVWLLFGC